jgi:hypothetical protein
MTMIRINQSSRNALSDVLRWAVESSSDASMAAADWLARDIDPNHGSVTSLLTDPRTTLEQLTQAKNVYKTMRIVGETVPDRRLAARLYLAAIAAAIVRYDRKITTQSDAALHRSLKSLVDDEEMPEKLRDLAGLALCIVKSK